MLKEILEGKLSGKWKQKKTNFSELYLEYDDGRYVGEIYWGMSGGFGAKLSDGTLELGSDVIVRVLSQNAFGSIEAGFKEAGLALSSDVKNIVRKTILKELEI